MLATDLSEYVVPAGRMVNCVGEKKAGRTQELLNSFSVEA